jgi:PAS domain S-box-containing protein
MNALQFVSPETAASSARAIREVFDRGECQVEATFTGKDGKGTQCLFTGKRIGIGGDGLLAGMAIDISQRKKVEDALRRSEYLLNKSQAIGHIGSWELDLASKQLTWSDEVYRIFGVRPQEFNVSYDAFFEAVHPDDRAAVKAAYWESVHEGRDTYEIEHRLIRGDNGEVRFVLEKCEHARDAAGSIVRSVGMVQDITERKQAEDSLRESEERFSVFMSHLPAAAFMKDADGHTLFANRYLLELFGIQDYTGKTTLELFSGTQAVHMTEDDRRALAEGPIRIQEILRDIRGCERTFATLKFPIYSTSKPVRLGGIAVDITELKRTEAALRESRERLSQALRAANAGAWEWRMQTNEAIWSDENYLVLGLEPDSVKSCYENWLKAVHPEDRAEADRLVAEAVQNRSEIDISYRVVWPDGSIHWINDRGKLVYDESGEPLGMYGIQIDITERKRAEEALYASEEKYRSIVEQTADCIWEMDLNGVHTFSNSALFSILGYRPEDFNGRTADSFLHPEDGAEVKAKLPLLMAEKRGWREWIVRFRHKDGSYRFLESNADPILDSTGELRGYRGVDRDITERTLAQEALRLKEEYYRSLLENGMDIVTILGPDGIILYESPSVERIVGYRPEELVGRDAFALIHPEDAGPTREIFGRLVRTPGSVEAAEFRFRHRDGSWRILEAIGKNLLQLPAVRAIVVNERDVTERRNAEEQLRNSLQQKETLLREIHHRVKNNLQVVSSLLDLQSTTVRNPEGIEALRESKQRVKTMAMIHERLYSRGDASSIVLKDYIEDLVHGIVQANIRDQLVAVQLDVPAISLGINSAVPCGLIINELVSNCLKHAFEKAEKGHILIQFRSVREKRLTLLIEDDGLGLPEDVDLDSGGSLGLSLVRALVKQLDGTIEIDRGAGTRFRITFYDKL